MPDQGATAQLTSQRLRAIIDAARTGNLTAQDLVMVSVRGAIRSGVLDPGSRLRQEDLAELFGTSRIPIREALRALEYEGLVRSEPHRGFRVTTFDADDVDEVFDLRIVLESHAVRLAMPLLSDDDLSELDGLHREMTSATAPDAELVARERFYMRLYSVSGRERLVSIIERLRHEVARSPRWTALLRAPAFHASFWEAVRTGDADRASSLLATQYRRTALMIRRYIREAEAEEREKTHRPGHR